MNKITPDKNIKIEIFDDFSLFSLNNITIGQYAAKIIQGSNNVILGNNAGKIAVEVNNSIFLGINSGTNISSGNSNISIGDDYINLNNIDNSINIGLNNVINKNNSITIGNNLINNDNNLNIGYSNSQININNSNISINDLNIGDIIRFGFNNSKFNDGINIGNYNSNINISIGSSNNSLNTNSIIIGNNISNSNFSLNINNLICKYEDDDKTLIYLGIGTNQNIPIIIGSVLNNTDDDNINDNNQIKIKGLLNINKLILKNNNNISITLKGNNQNIIYYLPPIPNNYNNLFLSVNKNGTLEWKQIRNDMITTIITSGDIICNNIDALDIKGYGYFINNINIDNNTTDNLNQGLKNIYFNNILINNLFFSIIQQITTDFIKDSFNSNLYYNENLYKINFKKNIETINSDFIYENNFKFYKLNDYFDASLNHLLSITTDDINIGVSNIFFTEEIVDNYSYNIINNIKEGKSNLYYTNNRFQNVFNNYISKTNTNEFNEGINNLYYNNSIVNNNFNQILNNINTDFINEGNSNLYFTNNRLINFFNSKIITTDNINEGSSNLYFNKINNFYINTDIIKEGTSNKYYTNDCNVKSRIINNTTTNLIKEGSSNKYLLESNLISQYNNYLLNDITTDNITINSNYSFITNNFYNNDLIIKGFIQSSNVNNIDISIDRLNLEMAEPTIGPLTEVINIYDYNSLFLNSRLSNVNIDINYDNNNINSNIPFIVVENRVGINNINPKFNLHVGTGNDTAFFSKLHLADSDIDTGNYGVMIISSNNNINGHDLKIQNRINPTDIFKDSLIINSSGNIGIGNNNPQSLLHLNISSPSSDIIFRMTDNTTGHTINNGLILKKDNLQNGSLWNYENANLIFGTNNIERFKIDNNGNCFINVPSSYNYSLNGYNQKLTIGGFSTGNTNWGQFYIYDNRNINDTNLLGLIFKADTFNNNCSIQTEKQGLNTNVPLLLNPNGNNVGIGLFNPTQRLHVSGNIVASGNITSSFSDIRLKTKTDNLNNCLDIITKLNGFKYKYNDIAKTFGFNDNIEMIGLNAQEVNEYIPEVISLAPFDMDKNDKDEIISKSGNNYLSIQYDRLIPYLIEAIKELKKENDIIKLSLNNK